MYYMGSNPPKSIGDSRGSVVLVSSTSGYFGGTAVVSYISSKHGITGLLRASQKAAKEADIRVNAVAPFFTPTHITSSYANAWREAGLPENKTTDVAAAIAQTATSSNSRGRCCLVGPISPLFCAYFADKFDSRWLESSCARSKVLCRNLYRNG
jgi:NAD(P)-dependent dehydrogenase (short-subunit alcohol dehydrogenase family)